MKATKFYLPFFHTGKPFATIYTYNQDTNTLYETYKDTQGTLNDNPIQTDETGKAIIYIDSNVIYKYVVTWQNSNGTTESKEYNNIQQMKGEAGTPGGPKGPIGDTGSIGIQGPSGGQGLPGLKGATGDKGKDYLTRVDISGNLEFIIPKGNEFFYVTGCGGGGSAANWSPYFYVYPQLADSGSLTKGYNLQCTLVNQNNTVANVQNQQLYNTYFVEMFAMTPGTGYPGEYVYRKKISLNKDIENVITVSCGGGGIQNTSQVNLNGNWGGDTIIQVNGVNVFRLKGGAPGVNQFPGDETNIPTLPTDGRAFHYNFGYNSSVLYIQKKDPSYDNTAKNKSPMYIDNSYLRRDGNLSVAENVKVQYTIPYISFYGNTNNYNYAISNSSSMRGGNTGFEDSYSQWQNYSTFAYGNYFTPVKRTLGETGWGSGGDINYNVIADRTYENNSSLTNIVTFENKSLYYIDKDYFKDSFINFCKNFTMTNSYSVGLQTIPTKEDTYSGVWDFLDNRIAYINTLQNALTLDKPGFYKDIVTPNSYNQANGLGGAGMPGYVIIEYGSIKEF